MRLDQALVHRNLCISRQEAQECIALGYVFVDKVVTYKQIQQVTESSSLVVTKNRRFVSRGGEKLEGALFHIYHTEALINQKLSGKSALDIGSSTGGFTDCLLRYGVEHVTCIDVGTSQLHPSLQRDTRITLFETTDIRSFIPVHVFAIIVADVSFISLEKIIDIILSFAKEGAEFFLLLKPQFEVGKGNTKKGIVRDHTLIEEVITKYTALLQAKGMYASIFPSSITGGDGNQEFFIYTKK